jgi:hypothetical protein
MSRYRLELWDSTNANSLGILSKWKGGNVIFELEGENKLSGLTVHSDDPVASLLAGRKYIRLVDNHAVTSPDYNSFIIQNVKYSFSDKGERVYEIDCEGLKYGLMDNMVVGKKQYVNIDATTALTLALAGSGFNVGTVDAASTNLNSLDLNWNNSFEVLKQITEIYYYDDAGVRKKFYYIVHEGSKNIDVLNAANIGASKDFYLHIDKNIKNIVRDQDFKGMANRVYGIGAEGFSIARYRLGSADILYPNSSWRNWGQATSGGVATMYDASADSPFILNDLFNGMQVKITGGTGANQKRIISDTIASTQRIVPASNFSPAPDNTSTYIVGYLESGDSMTYDLGLAHGNTDPLAVGTRIRGMADMYASLAHPGEARSFFWYLEITQEMIGVHKIKFETSWAYSSPNATLTMTITLLADDGTTVIATSIFTESITATDITGAYVSFRYMYYSLGSCSYYIDDPTSQSTYGIAVGKYENPNIQDTINLVLTPAFDGTYAAGLCANWTAQGAPTLAENTDPAFITNGMKSQKVSANDVGDGLSQALKIEPNTNYCAYFHIYVDPATPGNVECSVSDGVTPSTGASTGAGWIDITIEGFSYATDDLTVSVYCKTLGAVPLVFYVDSIMIHKGAAIHPFVDGDSVVQLYNETMNFLKQNKDPKTTYDLDLLDLYQIDPEKYNEENFKEGDSIRIVDSELALDAKFMVMRKEFPLDNPQDCKVTLSNKKNTFTGNLLKAMQNTVIQNRQL